MDQLNPLTQFFKAIEKDQRIALPILEFLRHCCNSELLQVIRINPIKAYRHEIMKTAKISGPVTCHRCTGDLNDYGYINYLPKRNRNQKSIIYFTV